MVANGMLYTHSIQASRVCICFYLFLPNICTSTIIKAMFMIVTDTRPANNNFIVKNKYCSTITPHPYVGGDTLMLFLIS